MNIDLSYFIRKTSNKYSINRMSVGKGQEFSLVNINTSDLINSQISTEIINTSYKQIFDYIHKCGDTDFINLIGVSDLKYSEYIFDKIYSVDSNNFISSGYICSEYVADSRHFSPLQIVDGSYSKIFYKFGNLRGKNLFVDAYQRYNDMYILSYSDVYYDIFDFKREESDSTVFIEYKYYFNVIDPKIIHLIQSENSPNYFLYKSIIRDNKIDDILNY